MRRGKSTLYDQDVIIKTYKKGEVDINSFYREIAVLSKSDHLSIINMFDYFQDRSKVILVFEYFNSTLLLDFLEKIDKGILKKDFDVLFVDLVCSVHQTTSPGQRPRLVGANASHAARQRCDADRAHAARDAHRD